MKNAEALKLPDPLLVRYYRADAIETIKAVAIDAKTRDILVTHQDGTTDKWKHLPDLGWVPDFD